MAEPAVVAVMGSCITRDNFNSRFNPGYRDRFTCPLHQNQTSLISLMSTPIEAPWRPTREMNDYDRWNVATELDKSFLAEVVALQPDYLILDFFADAFFGVAQLDTGEYVTDNRWKLRRTDLYRDWADRGRLTRVKLVRDAEVYLPLWEAAFEAFVRFARDRLPATTLVLHRGRFTDGLLLPGASRPTSLRDHLGPKRRIPVKRANRRWAELDDHAATRVDAVIDLTDRDYPSFPDHPWGPFYVHYAMEYYPRFLAQLATIDDRLLRRR
ncbi:DUF6270 domain-containing protein [Nocardioides sp. BP30]|uniref:DUF6270 domain-containing protein n=1 Tax=Nocardioides sp. BP30 TaxID=3036374 RepID=UPI0024697AD1|nr:DUF6270 domain-containing protein [Nocardioides sp. BP30]WGL52883.1 DUF6270 domain-containing protein [Nocardioides sp. BP30]